MRDELGLNGATANKKKILMVLIGAAVLIIISFITLFSGGGDDDAKETQKAGELAPIQDFEKMNQDAQGQPAPAAVMPADAANPNPVGAPADEDYTQLCRDKFESEYRAAGFEPKDYPDKADEYIKACLDYIAKNK